MVVSTDFLENLKLRLNFPFLLSPITNPFDDGIPDDPTEVPPIIVRPGPAGDIGQDVKGRQHEPPGDQRTPQQKREDERDREKIERELEPIRKKIQEDRERRERELEDYKKIHPEPKPITLDETEADRKRSEVFRRLMEQKVIIGPPQRPGTPQGGGVLKADASKGDSGEKEKPPIEWTNWDENLKQLPLPGEQVQPFLDPKIPDRGGIFDPIPETKDRGGIFDPIPEVDTRGGIFDPIPDVDVGGMYVARASEPQRPLSQQLEYWRTKQSTKTSTEERDHHTLNNWIYGKIQEENLGQKAEAFIRQSIETFWRNANDTPEAHQLGTDFPWYHSLEGVLNRLWDGAEASIQWDMYSDKQKASMARAGRNFDTGAKELASGEPEVVDRGNLSLQSYWESLTDEQRAVLKGEIEGEIPSSYTVSRGRPGELPSLTQGEAKPESWFDDISYEDYRYVDFGEGMQIRVGEGMEIRQQGTFETWVKSKRAEARELSNDDLIEWLGYEEFRESVESEGAYESRMELEPESYRIRNDLETRIKWEEWDRRLGELKKDSLGPPTELLPTVSGSSGETNKIWRAYNAPGKGQIPFSHTLRELEQGKSMTWGKHGSPRYDLRVGDQFEVLMEDRTIRIYEVTERIEESRYDNITKRYKEEGYATTQDLRNVHETKLSRLVTRVRDPESGEMTWKRTDRWYRERDNFDRDKGFWHDRGATIRFKRVTVSPENSENLTGKVSREKTTIPNNVWWGSNENRTLSNLALRPFKFEGYDFNSVEHAYQSLKAGEFDKTMYNMPGWKKAGTKLTDRSVRPKLDAAQNFESPQRGRGQALIPYNIKLMSNLMYESFKQNRDAKIELMRTNGEFTHVQDKGIWNQVFPIVLNHVYNRLWAEQPVVTVNVAGSREFNDRREPGTRPFVRGLLDFMSTRLRENGYRLKVISGGQNGADLLGLQEAKSLGLETGGTMPRNWRTEDGPTPQRKVEFPDLRMHQSWDWHPRNRQNVVDADFTILLPSKHSKPSGRHNIPNAGTVLTEKYARDEKKPYFWIQDLMPNKDGSYEGTAIDKFLTDLRVDKHKRTPDDWRNRTRLPRFNSEGQPVFINPDRPEVGEITGRRPNWVTDVIAVNETTDWRLRDRPTVGELIQSDLFAELAIALKEAGIKNVELSPEASTIPSNVTTISQEARQSVSSADVDREVAARASSAEANARRTLADAKEAADAETRRQQNALSAKAGHDPLASRFRLESKYNPETGNMERTRVEVPWYEVERQLQAQAQREIDERGTRKATPEDLERMKISKMTSAEFMQWLLNKDKI
jgi:hypothetical protein